MNQQNSPQYTNYNVLPSSTLAIVSLIAGLLGFTIPIIGAAVALWAGYTARKETRSIPPTASGDGLATAGIVLGWLQIGMWVVGACCFILYFGFFAALLGSSFTQ